MMSNKQTPNNNEEYNYEMPTSDMSKVGDNPMVSSSSISDIIETTGNVNPSRFWMIFMVILSVGLGLLLFFGGGYLTDEIKTLKQENKELQTKLDECPDKALERFKKQQTELEDLKKTVLRDAFKIDSMEQTKKRTLEKIEQIDKMK